MTRTQVGIVGAGPAGLTLAMLLGREGIECQVLELRDREYVEERVRAGLLEQGTVDLLGELGVDGRLRREGFRHDSFEVRFDGQRHHIPLAELTGGFPTWIYGQQQVLKDLFAAMEEQETPIVFEATDLQIDDVETDSPTIRYRHHGEDRELACDVVAGCDGFHGVSRQTLPAEILKTYSQPYPFAWLGILADAPPATTEELIYAHHPNGFALHSFRSTEVSRLYLQVPPTDDPGPVERRGDLGGAAAKIPHRGRVAAERRADHAKGNHPDARASSPNRCSTATCSSPATRRTSSRRPPRRGSTSPSPTSSSWRSG